MRFGLRILGTKGAIALQPVVGNQLYFADDPRWGRDGGFKQVAVPADEAAQRLPGAHWIRHVNIRIANDMIAAIEEEREPRCNIDDAIWTLEMILAVYESHRAGKPVKLPLASREHPLSRWA